MRARWNANTVLLTVFVLILIGAGVDYGRKVLGGTTPAPPPPAISKSPMTPDFAEGDPAPDFTLPDAQKKEHKLSELVKEKTVLFFACGCSNCKKVQTWLASMRKQKPASIPSVITVTSAPPEAQQAWLRDTGLAQTMLYWHPGVSPDPMAEYKGKPCPRLYVLNRDRTVKHIGSSMSELPGTEAIGMEIAKELDPNYVKEDSALRHIMQKQGTALTVPDRRPGLPPYAQPQ